MYTGFLLTALLELDFSLTRLVSESISLCSSKPTKYSHACMARLNADSGTTLHLAPGTGVDWREDWCRDRGRAGVEQRGDEHRDVTEVLSEYSRLIRIFNKLMAAVK